VATSKGRGNSNRASAEELGFNPNRYLCGVSEAFVTFRETLEAALVVGILARYVAPSERSYLWGGVLTAVGMSLGAAWVLSRVVTGHVLWEIGVSVAAAALLLYMVVWMKHRSASLSHELREAAQTQAGWMLFSLAFLAVAREGLETVLFLRALWQMQTGFSWAGGLLGVVLAMSLGLLIFVGSRRVPLRPFFNLTSIFLLLLAAGMAAYAVHELIELLEGRYTWAEALAEAKAWTLFPPVAHPPANWAWAYTCLEGECFPPLHHKGWIGGVLQALVGWRASMTWAEVAVWGLTFATGLLLWSRPPRRT